MGVECPKCHSENTDTARFCSNCATPLPSSKEIPATETLETPKEELTTGSIFAGRYQIVEVLGKGGMGKVYKAIDKKLNEEVALKLIKPEIASDKKTIERFRSELKIARKIRHKNVCGMYDLDEEKGTHYITMEYVPGEDLKSSIRRMGPLGAGKTLFIAKQICEGLAEAHRLGVVHRDLKPQNIMIDRDGNARIMDFGIARTIKGKGITGAGVMVGTPEYMSPEQAEVKEVDQRSDIYSLGVILYEMLTGRVPFEGETPLGIAMKHKSEMPKDPREINTQIPEDLSLLIIKCLEKRKEDRYPSTEYVFSELSKIEQRIPTTERIKPKRKPITSRELTVTLGLKKLFIPALAIIACIIVGLILWHPWTKDRAVNIPSDMPSLAILYFENLSGDKSLDGWRTGIANLLITDLMQSKLINVLPGDRVFSILKKLDLLESKKYTSEDLVKVASEGRVNHTISGSYIRAGENIIITLILQKPHTGKVINSRKVTCRGEEEIPPMVDDLTRQIKKDLDLSSAQIANDIDDEIENITTGSPEALKYYNEGMRYHRMADYREAIRLFERAVYTDPNFAMAYLYLARSYNPLGIRSKRRESLQKAFDLKDRVSDRERYIIQGAYYSLSPSTDNEEMEAYTKLLELYPEDLIANSRLATRFLHYEEWDKSIERSGVLIRNNVENIQPYQYLAHAHRGKGLYERAREILEDYRDQVSDNATIHYYLCLNHICTKEYKLALDEVNKALSIDPTIARFVQAKGEIFQCLEDYSAAEKEAQKLLESEEYTACSLGLESLIRLYALQGRFERVNNLIEKGFKLLEEFGETEIEYKLHNTIAHLHIRNGRPEEALKELNQAFKLEIDIDIGIKRRTLYLQGIAYLELNSVDDALKTADDLKNLIEQRADRKAIKWHYNLMGMIELEKGNSSEAIVYFNKAVSLLSSPTYFRDHHGLIMEPLGLAYFRSGKWEEAREVYEKITSISTGSINYSHIHAKAFFMLGKIYEELGNAAKSIDNYEKFLDLWKDADPGLPAVEDAKKRLAGLKSQ